MKWSSDGVWRRRLVTACSWFLTMQVVLVAWVFFRAQTFSSALRILEQMYLPASGIVWYPPFPLFAVVLGVLFHAIQATRVGKLSELPAHRWYTPTLLGLLWWILIVFPPRGSQPFIYFQF